nr:energy-coupled thiamine transporter ThiT [Geomicrobium sp. JCM 19055]
MQTRTLIMVEIALMTALALILDRIEFSGPWVMGGSITLVMLPIFVMAFRRGVKVGVATGLLVGTLKLVLAHRFSTLYRRYWITPLPLQSLDLQDCLHYVIVKGNLRLNGQSLGFL